jgi:hypothetical protein
MATEKQKPILSEKETKTFLKLLKSFESRLSDWKDNVSLDGKNLEAVNIEQVSWVGYYDEIKVELKYHIDDLQQRLKKQKAIAIKIIYETTQKSITDRMVDKLAEENKDYEDIYCLYLEFKNLYEKADSIVNVFQQRAYAINNIVKIREKELEGTTLHV